MKRLRLFLAALLLGVLAMGGAAPFLKADRYRPKIQAALETALNRRVELGPVHLNLFTGPGFSVEDVLIYDDPRAGIEPFAHVESLQARVSFRSLFGGHLAFSNLRLVEPSVNLVKPEAGPWNVQPLLTRRGSTSPGHRHSLPDIQISSGRLNFKFGDTKSVFYIANADVDVFPDENGNIVIRFSGEPARTDRASQGFGRFTARGMLRSGATGEDELNLGLHLERTPIAGIMTLVNGQDAGVHGFAAADARLSGPLSKLNITGDLTIDDVHRWDLMPPSGGAWKLNLRGSLGWRSQQLELETVALAGQPLPVSLKFRAVDYLSSPRWAASLSLHDLPAASLAETAQHMGAPLPGGLKLDGKVQGVVGYSREGGMQGKLLLEQSSAKLPQGSVVTFEAAPVVIAGNQVTFGPAEVRTEDGETALVEARYALDSRAAGLKIGSRQLTISEMRSGVARLFEADPIPFFDRLRQGTFNGSLVFDRVDQSPGAWTGEFEVQNASIDIPGVAAPLRLSFAAVEIESEQVRVTRIHGRAGAVKVEGEYRYNLADSRPQRLRLSIPEAQLDALEKLLLPTLRRQEGFLLRTFRLQPAALPEWLKTRNLEGTIQIKDLLNGDVSLGRLQAKLVWNGATARLTDIVCDGDDLHADGALIVNLSGTLPQYRANGRVEGLDYRGGRLNVEGELEASGIGESLLASATSEGSFEANNISLAPDVTVSAASGVYRLSLASGAPRLQLLNLQLEQNGDTLYGQGASQPDGRMVLDLIAGRKPVRLTGMLLPMHPENGPAR